MRIVHKVTNGGRSTKARSIIEITTLQLIVIFVSIAPFFSFIFLNSPIPVFNSIAADTYYYLKIAENTIDLGFTSFDGQTITNGYMPLWQMVVTGTALITKSYEAEPASQIQNIFIICLLLFSVSNSIIIHTLYRRVGLLSALIITPLVCPGAFFWLFEPPYRVDLAPGTMYGYVTWAFVNGMESSLGYFFFSLAIPLLFVIRERPQSSLYLYVALGGLSVMIFLSRLDDVFFGVAIGIYILLEPSSRILKIQRLLAFSVLPLTLGGIYLMANYFYVGVPFPTSGLHKTAMLQFPVSLQDFRAGHSLRLVPVSASLLVAVIVLSVAWRNRGVSSPTTTLLIVLGLYLLLKYFFLLSSVRLLSQGYWYYTLGNASLGILAALAYAAFDRHLHLASRISVLAILGLAGANALSTVHHRLGKYDTDSYAYVSDYVCQNWDRLNSTITARAQEIGVEPGIVDTFDGVYAYCLRLPAMSYTGLGSSPEVLTQRQEEGIFNLALRRGYPLVIDSTVLNARYDFATKLAAQGLEKDLLLEDGPLRVWVMSKTLQ